MLTVQHSQWCTSLTQEKNFSWFGDAFHHHCCSSRGGGGGGRNTQTASPHTQRVRNSSHHLQQREVLLVPLNSDLSSHNSPTIHRKTSSPSTTQLTVKHVPLGGY